MTPTSPTKKVLVTGGTGVVGTTLVRQLLKKGYYVRVLSRNGFSEHSNLAVEQHNALCRAEVVLGGITDPQALECALDGVEIVFHLAAMLGSHPLELTHRAKGRALSDQYRQVNVEGTKRLVEAAGRIGVARIVFFSSISVYGSGKKRAFVADESCSPAPDSLYAASKLEAERCVLAARNRKNEFMGVVLRVASVYGPKEKKNYALLIKMARYGFFITIGKGNARRTLIHDHDLARAAILAAEHPKAKGNIYNVTDGKVHSFNDIRKAIALCFGKQQINIRLPERLVYSLLPMLEKFPKAHFFASGLKNLVEDTAVSGDKIQRDLGFSPRVDLKNGWKNATDRVFQGQGFGRSAVLEGSDVHEQPGKQGEGGNKGDEHGKPGEESEQYRWDEV
ncbi:MAG: NAD-dependent epimerase/dehydratase family protein [Desulfobacteraceae bacterium]